MKPADLREFAEKLYVTAPRHEEFAKEILELLDREEDSVEAEMIEELEHHCPEGMHGKDPLKMIEYLGDRDDVLTEIEKKITDHKFVLKAWAINERPLSDADDLVDDLFDVLFDLDEILTAAGAKDKILKRLVYLRMQGGNRERTEQAPVVYDL